MNKNYTPGPWSIESDPFEESVRILGPDDPSQEHDGDGCKHVWVATVFEPADAFLIVNAPELLEACRVAMECIRNEIVFADPNDLPPQPLCGKLNRVHAQLADAIAKATGQEAKPCET